MSEDLRDVALRRSLRRDAHNWGGCLFFLAVFTILGLVVVDQTWRRYLLNHRHVGDSVVVPSGAAVRFP